MFPVGGDLKGSVTLTLHLLLLQASHSWLRPCCCQSEGREKAPGLEYVKAWPLHHKLGRGGEVSGQQQGRKGRNTQSLGAEISKGPPVPGSLWVWPPGTSQTAWHGQPHSSCCFANATGGQAPTWSSHTHALQVQEEAVIIAGWESSFPGPSQQAECNGVGGCLLQTHSYPQRSLERRPHRMGRLKIQKA